MNRRLDAGTKLEFERGMPASLDVERFLLGALIMFPEQIEVAGVEADWFSLDAHQKIWTAITAIRAEGGEIDRILVAEKLIARGQLDSIGGLSYLTSLDDGLPQAFRIEGYSRVLRDAAARRRGILALERANSELFLGVEPPEIVLSRAKEALDGVTLSLNERQSLQSVAEIVAAHGGIDGILSPERENAASIQVPFAALGMTMPNLRRSELTVLAARPAWGKTALAIQLAVAAASQGKGVACFSLEMDAREYLLRMVATGAAVNLHKHRRGYADADERYRMAATLSQLGEIPLFTDAKTGQNVAAIRSEVQRRQARQDISLVVVDYLQLMQGGDEGTRAAEVSAITRDLKLMASGLGVHVLALSQLTREAARAWGEGRDPENWMLMESGGIEANANNIWFIWPDRESFKLVQEGSATEMLVSLWVTKQRSGPTGYVQMSFNRSITRFDDLQLEAA